MVVKEKQKYTMSFEELSYNNIHKMEELMIELFGEKILNEAEFGYSPQLFTDILEGKYKSLYPLYRYYLIKINEDECGIIGFYNTFLFKNDVWLGWFRVSEKYNDIRAIEKSVLLLQARIEKYHKNVTHLRVYFDYSESKDTDIKRLLNLGWIIGNKRFSQYDSDDIVVLSKPLNGNKYEEWEKEPVW